MNLECGSDKLQFVVSFDKLKLVGHTTPPLPEQIELPRDL
jgi:hypothetical protein